MKHDGIVYGITQVISNKNHAIFVFNYHKVYDFEGSYRHLQNSKKDW